jgi:dolichol-phosphate mannosyltransferase
MPSAPRVLVTGATGFIGANLARRLLRHGAEVHLLAFHRDNTWRIEGLRDSAALHVGDLRDRDASRRLVDEVRPDWVFHCAVYGAYSWQTSVEQMVQTNVLGTIHLLEASRDFGVASFVNTGSSSEYGYKDHAPSEDEAVEPNSEYAVTKASASMYCRWLARSAGMVVTTLRLYSIYGPWEDPGRLIPTLIHKGLRGELPPLVDPSIARDYVSVEDACEAYVAAARRTKGEKGAVYNVGTGIQTTIAEVVRIARSVLGIEAEPSWGSMANRKWDTSIWVSDPSRIARELGWSAADSFEQGFRRTVDWARREAAVTPAPVSAR